VLKDLIKNAAARQTLRLRIELMTPRQRIRWFPLEDYVSGSLYCTEISSFDSKSLTGSWDRRSCQVMKKRWLGGVKMEMAHNFLLSTDIKKLNSF
jgi:hypothetical protein